ncbi:MAG: hypothetical protein ACWGQW_00685 [bacterium]
MSKNTKITGIELSDGTFAVVGHYVGFKCDVEQHAKVTSANRSEITVEAPIDGFSGDYIRGMSSHVEDTDRCWGGLTADELKALNAPAKKATRKPSTKKATTSQPVDKKDRANTLARALDSRGSLTAEQAADVLKLQGQFRKQAAVATLTQLVKAGHAVKRTIKGVTTYCSK